MKLKVDRENLYYGLQTVSRAVPQRANIEALKGVCMETEENMLHLRGTDLDMEITCQVPVEKVEEHGSIVLPAKRFLELVKSLSNGAVEIIEEESKATIKQGKSKIGLNCYAKADFPDSQETQLSDKQEFEIKFDSLKEAALQVLPAVAKSDNRPILTGVCLQSGKDNSISFIATDTYRLAIKKVQVSDIPEITAVVPARALVEVSRLHIDPKETIYVQISDKKACFKTKDVQITVRLLDGSYPNVYGVIPDKASTRIQADRAALLSSVERCLVVADIDKSVVQAEIKDSILSLLATSEVGSVQEPIDIEKEGEELELAFNPNYLLDCLKANENNDKLELLFNGPLNPIVVQRAENPDLLYLLLPVKVAEVKKSA